MDNITDGQCAILGLAGSQNLCETITLCSYIFRTATERQLKAAREEIETLRTRLREAMKISEEQKQHFRANIEELKSQLHDAISKRDSVLAQKYVLIPILCQKFRNYQMLSMFKVTRYTSLKIRPP